jgi:TonB family protein
MTASLTLAVLFALQFATPPPPLLRLEVDAFRGARTGNDSRSRSPLATRILAPWAAGWSDDTDLQRTRIRDVAGLEHATLVLSETMPFERRSGTIRGAGYWIGVRFPRVGTRDADLEIRIVRDRNVEAGLGAPSAASVTAALDLPFVLTSDGENERDPVFVTFTLTDHPRISPFRYWWPRALNEVAPVYPALARASGVRGKVVIKALVDTDGTVVEPFVLEPLQRDLDTAALEAVRKWRYRPATSDGKPIPAMVWVTCHFSPPRK